VLVKQLYIEYKTEKRIYIESDLSEKRIYIESDLRTVLYFRVVLGFSHVN
jgi:hypothetical protein